MENTDTTDNYDDDFEDLYEDSQNRNLELIEVKKLEKHKFKVSLDLGFEKFVGENTSLEGAILDVIKSLNWFCWRGISSDLVHLTRKYTENTRMWLENWCSSKCNKDNIVTFGFKEKYNDPYDLILSSSSGMDEILAEYKKGRSLVYIYREWKYNDIRLGVTFNPSGKKHKEQFEIVIQCDNHPSLIRVKGNDRDIWELGSKLSINLTALILKKLENEIPCS